MKKIKICISVMLFAMAVCILSACGNKESDKNQTTNPAGTAQSTTAAGGGTGGSGSSGTNGTSGTGATESEDGSGESGSRDDEESGTGVLDDMAEDLEEGADDVMNGPGVTSASDESR